jgi:2-keto-4-pentenoate hydratase/2-oxohepta-3-ene-1,7-dioic acid hydratase in catechol pathway
LKLLSFRKGGKTGTGILCGRTVVDIGEAWPILFPTDPAPGPMRSLIAAGPPVLERLRRVEEAEENLPDHATMSLERLDLLPPLPDPPKIIGVTHNYGDFLSRAGMEPPAAPRLFAKLENTVIGPGASIVLPRLSRQVSYEAEVAVILGKRGKNIPKADAFSYVFGYTIINDVSAMDIVKGDGNLFRGKNFDTFFPMGPFIVTKDQIPDPHNLRITLAIDGRTLQDSSSAHMVKRIPELISYISGEMTLQPGDMIATGTPAGTSLMHDPPAFLTPGCEVTIHIDKLGCLSNPVAAAMHGV